ncbi:MAG: spore germination protein [Clostridia bacterium]|nr:spore germination protein [Clostridia bacterium]
MFKRLNKKNAGKDRAVEKSGLTKSLDENVKLFQEVLKDDETLVIRRLNNKYLKSARFALIYFEGMIKPDIINENIIRPLIQQNLKEEILENNLVEELRQKIIAASDVFETRDIYQVCGALAYGDTVLIVDGFDSVLVINSKGWHTRGIEEPLSEKIVRGPREGFNESIMMNLSLIRRKIKNPGLKIQFREIGVQTRTKVCICYLEGTACEKIVEELRHRLDKIDIDGILDSGYIQELIRDEPFSPFDTIGITERPDIAAAKLLEGRIALLVDGSPFALTLPFLFIEYFQTNEDYYNNYFFGSVNRLLRVAAGLLSIAVPAIYVALVTFHQEMIPTPLLLSISAARQGVPFPTIVEALLMLTVFELLREAGTRIPTTVGQAVSIVGALVLGQAAVDARFVSAPIVIIAAFTGITALLSIKSQGAAIFFRLVFLFLGSMIGVFGIIFSFLGLIIHLMSLRSFGVPYMLNISSLKGQDVKDTAIRAPWWHMRLRPPLIAAKNMERQKKAN